jgi:hypothetical protein
MKRKEKEKIKKQKNSSSTTAKILSNYNNYMDRE